MSLFEGIHSTCSALVSYSGNFLFSMFWPLSSGIYLVEGALPSHDSMFEPDVSTALALKGFFMLLGDTVILEIGMSRFSVINSLLVF